MKKVYLSLLCLIFVSLMFFTAFGDYLYNWGKPTVTTTRAASNVGPEGVLDGILVPINSLQSDVSGDYIYILLSEQGYSRNIYSVSRIDVEVLKLDQEVAVVLSSGNLKSGDSVVTGVTGTIKDGSRVLWN